MGNAPDSAEAPGHLHRRLAARLRTMNLPRLATACLEEARAAHPHAVSVAQAYCEHLLAVGAIERAAAEAEAALRQIASPELRLVLARALAAAGRLNRADAQLTELLNDSRISAHLRAFVTVHALRVAVALDRPRRALALARQAVSLDPLPPEAARAVGDLAGQLPSWARLHQQVEQRRQAQPEDAVHAYLAARLLASARFHHEPGIPAQEIERLLRRALQVAPGFHLARLMLALRQVRRRFGTPGARHSALEHLRFVSQALRLDSDALGTDAGLVDLLLGALLEETPDTHDAAVDAYHAGLRRIPGHAVAATNLGALYVRQGDVEAARGRFIAALAADPHYAPAYHQLIRTLDLSASPEQTAREVEALVARLGVPRSVVTGRFVAAMAEDAREQALSAVAAKASQLHAQIGLLTARLRAKASESSRSDPASDLYPLAATLQSEWSQYARTLEGPGDALPDVLDLRRLVWDVIRQETQADGRAEVHIANTPPNFPDVKGYRGALLEAVRAIVRNGLEAQPDASPPLRVTLQPLDHPATRVELTVRDFGPGISALHRAQLFSPGYTTKRQRPGYGLSLARRAATAHQGWIVVEPAAPRGTLVRLVLPVDLYGLPALIDAPFSEPLASPAPAPS